ncbi:gamma-glutamylcyclotransferase family protein [Aquabacter spiritensis]|uniref:Gamma-glutamylcyclotransferase n=1 Tax=Aquabacter spiritensis TaxID=933073 RepID=A0A4R3LVV0_9HYPH|nr:gamma-glutamylcyclotransferase family protein [Aquabacter spiritensis]TCT02597.1 hypothetical protein EDC64_11230 [Aquabacter spiritensis]
MVMTRRAFLAGLAAAPAGLSAVPAWGKENYWREPLAAPPTDFIFGYGSLINTPSRESTGRPGMGVVPARLSPDFGLIRSWCARGGNFTALGLRPRGAGEAGASINGVVFPVDAELLPRFDRREGGYDRVAVARPLIEPLSWQGLPETGTIWAYVPKHVADAAAVPLLPDAHRPLVQSYIDLVLLGALEYGESYAAELIATTADWGAFWLNDRETARRPWVALPKAGTIDGLLRRTMPASASFPDRLFPETYTARHLSALRESPAPAR